MKQRFIMMVLVMMALSLAERAVSQAPEREINPAVQTYPQISKGSLNRHFQA